MGATIFDDEWDCGFTSGENFEARTVVLVGKVRNGKSGTGNSILGGRAFLSKPSLVGVTATSELQATVLEDGQTLNVIDTPGLLDYSREPEIIREEILKCIKMAKEGIHAVLLVLSVRSRYSVAERNAVENLLEFFGRKISDYMIVVFTGGDELEACNETLDVYLDQNCPDELKEILEVCGNRRILFDNKTENSRKKSEQVKQLLSLVNEVVERNGGKPYTNELFLELKNEALKLREQAAQVNSMKDCSEQEISGYKKLIHKSFEKQHKRLADLVDSKLNENTRKLELQLAKEKAARLKAERMAQTAQSKSDEQTRQLRANLENAEKLAEELRKKTTVLFCNGIHNFIMSYFLWGS